MKRLFPFFILLFVVASAPVFALDNKGQTQRPSVIADVIKMSQAGVADEAIISFVVYTRDRLEVTADDIITLTNAHVSKDVIKAMVDEAADRKESRPERSDRVYVAPTRYYGWYDPFYYPYYDPFWYGPRVSVGFGFGFSRHFGGHRFGRRR